LSKKGEFGVCRSKMPVTLDVPVGGTPGAVVDRENGEILKHAAPFQ
jgi:hypothetical protein